MLLEKWIFIGEVKKEEEKYSLITAADVGLACATCQAHAEQGLHVI